MDIRDIEIFTELTNTKNITRASERLGLAQPSLSAWLNKIEVQLKTKLFTRSKKGLELTASGLRLIEKSKDFKNAWEALLNYVQDGDDTQKIIYRFGCHESVALYSLDKILPSLQKHAPQIELNLKHDLSRRLTEDIVSDRLDLGIIINPLPHPDLIIKKIGSDEVKFWQNKLCKNPQNLICDPELKQAQQLLRDWQKKRNPTFLSTLTTPSLELAAQLCAHGIATSILPSRVAAKYKNIEPCSNTPIFKDEICLVFKNGFQHRKNSRQLIDLIMSAGI